MCAFAANSLLCRATLTLPSIDAASFTTVLSVPVIAAAAGLVWLCEPITSRLSIAAVAALGGIFMVFIRRRGSARERVRG
jgi:drug/metabolite transporter (DMT)-like permease